MVNREITFVPGLYKIFDEILGKLFLLLTNSNQYHSSIYLFRTFFDQDKQLKASHEFHEMYIVDQTGPILFSHEIGMQCHFKEEWDFIVQCMTV